MQLVSNLIFPHSKVDVLHSLFINYNKIWRTFGVATHGEITELLHLQHSSNITKRLLSSSANQLLLPNWSFSFSQTLDLFILDTWMSHHK